ncbi:MAG TPA: hypothetical protein VIN59_00250 [Alphaproteobacteria bacterium]
MPMPSPENAVPFHTAEETWFWFMQANQARMDGARFKSAEGSVARPCEPVDILRILDRLYRTRRLMMDHLRVMRFYGLRQMPPEKWRRSEMRAATLWAEAMRALEPVLIAKKIMREPFQGKVISMMAAREHQFAGAWQ